jgi:hypothetical protein
MIPVQDVVFYWVKHSTLLERMNDRIAKIIWVGIAKKVTLIDVMEFRFQVLVPIGVQLFHFPLLPRTLVKAEVGYRCQCLNIGIF